MSAEAMSSERSIVDQALQLTRDMLGAGQAQEWERLATLEAQRDPLLRREHSADVVYQLSEILACDRELRALVRQARDEAAAQWQRENGRARAISAYAQA
ncbi:flagellar protein FliT [Rhodanobacter caeni]|uniref:Flagellar protein FliT n=1 Tax=Rhodanobacter caeni TaxID=657654 RepID=A0ABN0UP44_9GAMM